MIETNWEGMLEMKLKMLMESQKPSNEFLYLLGIFLCQPWFKNPVCIVAPQYIRDMFQDPQ